MKLVYHVFYHELSDLLGRSLDDGPSAIADFVAG